MSINNPAVISGQTTTNPDNNSGYVASKPENTKLNNLLNSNVESTNYVLIVLAVVIAIGMAMPTMEINDESNILGADNQIVTDLNVISSELTKLKSSITSTSYDVTISSVNGYVTVSYGVSGSSKTTGSHTTNIPASPNLQINIDNTHINPADFNLTDLKNLMGAVYNLYTSDPANQSIGDCSITVNVDGTDTTYYLNPNGTWTTTPPANLDQPASDYEMYQFYNTVAGVDKDVMYSSNGSITSEQASSLFPTSTSGITDSVSKQLSVLYNDLNMNNPNYNDNTSNSWDSNTFMQDINNLMSGNGTGQDLAGAIQQVESLGYAYYETDLDGGSHGSGNSSSMLDTLTSDTNSAITAANNFSSTETNNVQQSVQELSSINQVGQTIQKDANQALQNSINSQRVS